MNNYPVSSIQQGQKSNFQYFYMSTEITKRKKNVNCIFWVPAKYY